ncbi:related to Glutathione S-transferase, mitochondrial [Melanopsichium pennsylvanicum]|uniref:Glutathione S-transferase kappa n=2 Tax=Melanopsichium pennsylvanicum TaxID=63383 RepID=A0AAJ5C7R3_9BASI|nr:related to Glutathione S-transferase, mitochondrial [Melanopsichium pennsylvanicum 4]SNX86833.1 related to Glutathione S-transferase, mitochondrial [Melanopsichium pennsylvanicum]
MSTPNKVAFYFDVVSPWSYVAYQVLRRYQKPWNLDITYKPVNLGYIMKFSGNKPPISVVNKGIWMWQERDRAATFFGVTLNPTKEFPINTMQLQTFLRTLCDTPSANRAILEKAIETCFAAIWHYDLACTTREDLEIIFAKQNHLDLGKNQIAQVLDQSMTKQARTKLQQEAKELVEQDKLFGMPSFQVQRGIDGEKLTWFGSDRFEQLAAWLHVPYKGPFADGSVAKL